MWSDEPLDDETSRMYGTESTVDALVKFANKMNEAFYPEDCAMASARGKRQEDGFK